MPRCCSPSCRTETPGETPRCEDRRVAPVLAREGRTPIMHLASTRRWGGCQEVPAGPPGNPARSSRRSRRAPGGSHGGAGTCSGKSPSRAGPGARWGWGSPWPGAGLRGAAPAGLGVGSQRLARVHADLPPTTPAPCPLADRSLRVGRMPGVFPRNFAEACFMFLDLLPSRPVFVAR